MLRGKNRGSFVNAIHIADKPKRHQNHENHGLEWKCFEFRDVSRAPTWAEERC